MNFLRETSRSIKDDDNSYKFILIDRNARKHGSGARKSQMGRESHVSSETTTGGEAPVVAMSGPPKESAIVDVEADKLHKLRKKMFWNRTSSNVDNLLLPNSKLSGLKPTVEASSISKPANRLLNSFKHIESNTKLLNGLTSANSQFRSTSLSHASSYKQQRSESISVTTSTVTTTTHGVGVVKTASNISSKKVQQSNAKSNELISHTYVSNLNQVSSIPVDSSMSTSRPFYSKLKKSHLFGVKLEKLCGPYSATNLKLPPQIMV